ncbi:uncharacterized protein K444DRAFT_361008 [Hyaloscypha bicolor E]|uniref:Uncharacterized protein n=1 Tax=Hyaloscypha bicolor E TaxID=1095630 RepID=A0A2J6TGA5_9HELO|nr:uncharacterized protein K444DRAFT_361008 [Hyaloscypha bicolor E]PMD62030.1 hypothetical protein K444DRAFT_361008 [Hyaloscypha bicolor E]
MVNDQRHWAFVDNHSSGNIMSLEMASWIGLSIHGDGVNFRMIDGTVERSLGHVWVDCSLITTTKTSKQHRFHIFATPIKPLIIGGPFLYDSGILIASPSASIKALDLSNEMDLLSHTTDCVTHQYPMYLIWVEAEALQISAEAIAVADTGANADLMSLAFAREKGFPVQPVRELEGVIMTANGKIIRSKGIIIATVCFSNHHAHPFAPLRCRFVVIENLPFDVVLGRSFVNQQNLLRKSKSQLYHHMAFEQQHTCCSVEELSKMKKWLAGAKGLDKPAGKTLLNEIEKNINECEKIYKEWEQYEVDGSIAVAAQLDYRDAWNIYERNKQRWEATPYKQFVSASNARQSGFTRLDERYRIQSARESMDSLPNGQPSRSLRSPTPQPPSALEAPLPPQPPMPGGSSEPARSPNAIRGFRISRIPRLHLPNGPSEQPRRPSAAGTAHTSPIPQPPLPNGSPEQPRGQNAANSLSTSSIPQLRSPASTRRRLFFLFRDNSQPRKKDS